MTTVLDALVVGILAEPGQDACGAAQSIARIADEGVHVEIAVRGDAHDGGLSALDHALALQVAHPDRHVLLLDANAYLPSTFLESVRGQLAFFAERTVPWGVIGTAGVAFPYFTPVRNMLVAGAPAPRFAGTLPAAQLDPQVLLIHRDVQLAAIAGTAGCPADAPLGDLATLAAWEAGLPCWIGNLPVYLDGAAPSPAVGDVGAWARYLATRYNNASLVSAYGTIALSGHAEGGKDYYYGMIEPVLARATRHLDTAHLSVFVVATYYDPDIFDRCLMGIVSQFQRPQAVYLVGLERIAREKHAEFCAIVERYRAYATIHWSEEELPETAAAGQLVAYLDRVPADGHSLLVYDTCVLFPQAVRQIAEFLQYTLGDAHVLPITSAEVSRLFRRVAHVDGRPHAFFREVEKIGFTHRERWLSAESSSTLHFTFPNAFLRGVSFAGIDFADLGSALPQRLLAAPLSFFLIERAAGYDSFQLPLGEETVSPLAEGSTPFHLANKAGALFAARSNMLHYAIEDGGIVPALSWRDEAAAAQWLTAGEAARKAEFAADWARIERELAELRNLSDRQEASLVRFRNTWYFRVRRGLNPRNLRTAARRALTRRDPTP